MRIPQNRTRQTSSRQSRIMEIKESDKCTSALLAPLSNITPLKITVFIYFSWYNGFTLHLISLKITETDESVLNIDGIFFRIEGNFHCFRDFQS